MMRKISLAVAVVMAASTLVFAQVKDHSLRDATAERDALAFRSELLDALKRADRRALESMIAQGFTFTHATGRIETRASYMERAIAGAQTTQRSDVETLDNEVHVFDGRTAVLVSRGVLHPQGQASEIHLRSSWIFVRSGAHWQWAYGQSTRLPSRPQAATIDPGALEACLGEYAISGGRSLTVMKECDTLHALVTGTRPAELVPKSETQFVWFDPESNVYSELLFVKDNDRVTDAIFRREGDEIWHAQKGK
jgi:uncharacterized protein DUF4440